MRPDRHFITFGICFGILVAVELPAQENLPATIHDEWSDAVVGVVTPFGSGSGLVVDSSGIVLTNAHVVEGTDTPHVKVDVETKVRGVVLGADEEADLAAVKVHPSVAAGIEPPPLAPSWREEAGIGDPVVIVGFPLMQGKTVTAGIISRFDRGAFLTDAFVNAGNSGGPVFDGRGRVIGIATFLVAERVGAGLSGVVDIGDAVDLLQGLDDSAAVTPSPDRLPVMPDSAYPVERLRAAARQGSWPVETYDVSDEVYTGDFNIHFYTPPLLAWLRTAADRLSDPAAEAAEDEDRAVVPLAAYQDLTRWRTTAGAYPRVVIIRVVPRVERSRGAIVGNLVSGFIAGAAGTSWTPAAVPLEVRASFEDVTIYRGAESVLPIRTEVELGRFRDRVVRSAYIFVGPELFAPDDCEWPSVRMQLTNPFYDDAYNPDEPDDAYLWGSTPIPENLMRQIWRDFADPAAVARCEGREGA